MDRVKVTFHLDYPGLDLDRFGWQQVRDFMEVLVRAIDAMPGVADARLAVPTGLRAGSAVLDVSIPRGCLDGVRTLQKGPTRSWTTEMVQQARPLYLHLNQLGATLSCQTRGRPKPMRLPANIDEETSYRETGVLRGTVEWAGGKEGKVGLATEFDGQVRLDAGRDRAAELAKLLYKQVEVDVELVRDALTHRITSGTILDTRKLKAPLPMADALARIRAAAGLVDFDAEAALRELRG